MKKQATALLLNYKRPNNVLRIIESLRSQTIPIEIFLWNNNPDGTKFDVDFQIDSSKNVMCSARWMMACYAKTPFVFSLDDDLMPRDNNVIADSINELGYHDAIGYTGVKLNRDKNYWASLHIGPHFDKNTSVDIIKGRFLMTHKFKIGIDWNGVEMKENYRVEDDIVLSASLKYKIIPSILYNRFLELASPHALMRHPEHRQSRQYTVREYF